MKIRNAFTMIELIFVIVVMGIIGKFGVEFLVQAYNSFIGSSVNNALQANSGMAVEFIATRLQDRIKDSIIVREGGVGASANDVVALSDANPATTYRILEWVGADGDGFRGDSLPNWSGIIDLDHIDANASLLISPETNTTAIDNLIKVLADNPATSTTTINNAALYFIGSNSDIQSGYGWTGALADQNGTMHPINSNGVANQFIPKAVTGTFHDVYEYYKLAWTAYAIVYTVPDATKPTLGTLTLHYGYQPWNGDKYDDNATKKAIIMENVNTFRAMAIGSVVKIQVCVKSALIPNEEYSLCKEKTVF